MHDPAGVLRSNLNALSLRNPGLAQAIRECAPDPRITSTEARTGARVVVVQNARGGLPLHSLYDPEAEARKIIAALPDLGCVVALGLGAGFLVSALLEDPNVALVFVVEKDAATLRSLFACVPLERLLADPRVSLVAGAEGIPSTAVFCLAAGPHGKSPHPSAAKLVRSGAGLFPHGRR